MGSNVWNVSTGRRKAGVWFKENINTFNPVKIVFHEWGNVLRDIARGGSITNAVKYFINPPGWSHDGRSKTTKQLRGKIRS